LDRRLGGHQSWYGHGGEDKNSQPLPGLEHPIIQPTELKICINIHHLICNGKKEGENNENSVFSPLPPFF
jgi:hypothetical protein